MQDDPSPRVTEHELKCWPPYFEEIALGRKTFEVRLNDRDYRMLDIVRLREFNPSADALSSEYTGREIKKRIGYVLHGGDPAIVGMEAAHSGIAPGYVVLSFTPTTNDHQVRWSETAAKVRSDQLIRDQAAEIERLRGVLSGGSET